MKLFRFVLPKQDNKGVTMVDAYVQLRRFLLNTVGGWTAQPEVTGAWKDDGGQEFRDTSWVLEVALEDAPTFDRVMSEVRRLWPDQLSFFVAYVGEAFFVAGQGAQPKSPDALALLSGAGAEWVEAATISG